MSRKLGWGKKNNQNIILKRTIEKQIQKKKKWWEEPTFFDKWRWDVCEAGSCSLVN